MISELGGLRLIVVENDALMRELIEGMLIELGHEIVGRATTAAAAIAEAKKKFPDAVLMDIRLDGVGDGVDAACAIRSQLGVRSLFLTVTTDSATRARSVPADPIGYLEKPVTLAELAAALSRVRGALRPAGMGVQ